MRKLHLASLLLVLSPAARAASSWWLPNTTGVWAPAFDLTGHVELAERVTVPLLSTNGWSDIPVVAATLEDGSIHLVAVDLGATRFRATESFASATGARIVQRPRLPWGKRGDVKLARLGAFSIGSATFSDIPVQLEGSIRVGAMTVDAVLPPALFEDLAVAVHNSAGQLVLAPAEEGAALVAELEGATRFTWRRREGREDRLGDLHFVVDPQAWLVDANLGGQEVEVRLFGSAGSLVGATLVEGREPVAHVGATPIHLLELEVPGLASFSGPYAVRPRPSYDLEDDLVTLGEAHDDTWDVAVDPVNHALAIRTGVAPVRTSIYPALVQQVLLDASDDGGEDAPSPLEATAFPEDLPDLDDGGVYAQLADLLCQAGQGALCAQALERAAELSPDDCSAQQAWGRWLSLTDPEAAAPVLERAAELWSAWDALTPKERKEAREAGDEAEVTVQPSSCHTIWAEIAANQVRMGQPDAARATWQAHRDDDLDGSLSRVVGGAGLLVGDPDAAFAPYRYGASRRDPLSRLGLALVEDARFQAGKAIAHAWDNAIDRPHDVPALEALARVAEGAGGPTVAVEVLKRLVALRPHDPVARMVLAEARVRAGQDPAADLEAALARFEVLRALNPENVILMGQHARCLLDAEQPEYARTLAEQALASGIVVPQARIVLARLQGREVEERRELARLGVAHPGFAAALDW